MTQSRRILCFAIVAAVVLLLPGLPIAASAQTQVTPNLQPPLTGTTTTVNNGPGDHSDPHISGNTVSYSNSDGTNFTIRYHDLVTGSDNGVPNSGTFDFLSDVSGNTIAFTRVSSSASAIFTYVLGAASASEVDPTPSSARQSAQIANNIIAWQENSSGTAANIVVLNTVTNAKTSLTGGAGRLNASPAVSPDGTVVAWVSCASISAPCDVWSATNSGGTWVTHQLTNGNGNCSHPDTNGSFVAYSCNRGSGDRLFWQSAAGGPENELNLAGNQSSPSIGGQWIAFSGLAPSGTSHNIFVYNLATNNLYQVSATTGDNQLNDISITSDGTVNVVWQVQQTSLAVYAFRFNVSVADLAIQKIAFPSTVDVGQGIAYGLVVHNLGPNTATGVIVSDALPANTVFVGAIASQGTCTAPAVGSPGTVSCNLGSLINGGYAAVGIAVKVTGGAGTTITNTATVGASTFDPTPNDNSASVSTTVAQGSPDD